MILTDTVGFISDLPKDLLTAFQATVEELADADLLLHVVDASDEHLDEKKQAVERLLEKLDLAAIPRLVVRSDFAFALRPLADWPEMVGFVIRGYGHSGTYLSFAGRG